MIYLVMGVSGVGKSTVGHMLASRLKVGFLDADHFHFPNSIAKMRGGIPLNDGDRGPWLLSLNRALIKAEKGGQDMVLACSALKESYREKLFKGIKDYMIIHLYTDISLLKKRLEGRKNHFFNPGLLESQIKIFETPKRRSISIDARNTVEHIVSDINNNIFFIQLKSSNQSSF